MSDLLKLPCGGGFFSDESFSIEKKNGKEYIKAKGGVSSWNDLPDKPFYEEDGLVTVLPEQGLQSSEGYGTVYLKERLVLGETYIVNWDGEEYECVGDEEPSAPGVVILGNSAYFGGSRNDAPIIIMDTPNYSTYFNGWEAQVLQGVNGTPLAIYRKAKIIKPVAGKYFPKADAVANVTDAPTAEQFNALLASLREAGYLAE